jgi:hypothetical protein
MQTFVVRPVILGLLALIAAGLWGVPLGAPGSAPVGYQSSCHGAASETSPSAVGVLVRRGVHC